MASFVLQSVNWATTYTNITGPHHNIKTMYHGEPAKLSEEYRKVFGTNSIDSCSYEPDGHDDYCDVQECALRNNCNSYKLAHPEPVTPEQAEQMTLQWATRMGGVGTITHAAPTITHSVNGEGEATSTTNDREDWEARSRESMEDLYAEPRETEE